MAPMQRAASQDRSFAFGALAWMATMQVPGLPTDSLWKFLTVAGFLLAGTALYFAVRGQGEFKKEYALLIAQAQVASDHAKSPDAQQQLDKLNIESAELIADAVQLQGNLYPLWNTGICVGFVVGLFGLMKWVAEQRAADERASKA